MQARALSLSWQVTAHGVALSWTYGEFEGVVLAHDGDEARRTLAERLALLAEPREEPQEDVAGLDVAGLDVAEDGDPCAD